MKAKLAILIVLILTLAVPTGCNAVGHYVPYMDNRLRVSPQPFSTVTVHAGAGDMIQGYFTIRGGQHELKFWVEDPYEASIYDAGMVYDRHDFQLICAREGYYTLYFDNSFSWTAGKRVYVRFRVRST